MKRIRTLTALVVVALWIPAAYAQDDAEVAVEPAAIEALDVMASYLRTLEEFRLTATTTIDEVVEGGDLVEIAGRAVYEVRTPDRMKLDITNDKWHRIFFYDGSTVTQYAPALGYYAIFAAAPTIAETLDLAYEEYDVELPLADLFFWGTEGAEGAEGAEVTSAFQAPDARISGEACAHYVYRAKAADFQVWIRKHGDPLPCKLVVVTTGDESRPRYSATLDWDVDALIGDTVFFFAPPPGSQRIAQETALEMVAE